MKLYCDCCGKEIKKKPIIKPIKHEEELVFCNTKCLYKFLDKFKKEDKIEEL